MVGKKYSKKRKKNMPFDFGNFLIKLKVEMNFQKFGDFPFEGCV